MPADKSGAAAAKTGQSFLQITVVLGARTYAQDLDADAQTPTDLGGLNQALATHPARFAWWAMLEALARAQHDELETQLKQLEAGLFVAYTRKLTAAAEGGKPTLDAIKTQVTLDPRRAALVGQISRAKLALDQVGVGRQTMLQRKEALISIASNMRAEMEAKMFTIRDRTTTRYPEGSKAPGRL